jgi:hypothetical protein
MSEKLLAAGSVTLMAAGSLLGASAAQAATVADCGTHPDATVTLINGSICEVVYDTVGEHTFTPPAGISAFEAVLIGGGAGAGKSTVTEQPDYLDQTVGYGGWMEHYVYEDVSGTFDVYVGAGGTPEERVDTNAEPVYTGGESGEDSYLGDDVGFGSNGRIGLYESEFFGEGQTLSDLFDDPNPLFPVLVGEPLLSLTGSIFANVGDCPVAKPVYGSGGNVCGTIYEGGMSGAVFIRWALPSKLASTGVEASAIGIGAGALLAGGVALGAVAAVRRARAKN